MSTRTESIGQAPPATRRLRLPTSGVRLLSFLGLLVASLGLAPLATTASAQVSPHQSGTSGIFVPVTPFRVLDTRSSTGGTPFGPNTTEPVTVEGAGSGTVPTTGVTAVVATVTALKATGNGYLQIFPAAGGLPSVSNLNYRTGQTVPNLVTVPVAANGQVDIHSYIYNQASTGSVQVLMDISGYYTTSVTGTSGLFNPITPVRIADTRANSGQPDSGTALASKSTTALTVTGSADGVPSSASAVVLNVTVAGPTAGGFLTVWPAGASQPTASNLNFVAGQVVANRVIVGIGSAGQVDLYNSFGSTNVIVDVNGWYTGSSGGTGSAYFPVTPTRVVDTRSSFGGTPIAAAGSENFTLAGSGDIPATGATAAVLNVTAVATPASGYLTVWPSSAAKPTASDVNWSGTFQAVPNLTQVGLGTAGAISIFNGGPGTVGVLVDVFGYFGASNVTGVGISSCTANATPCPAGDTASTVGEGGTLYLTATVDKSGAPVASDGVLFTLSGTACGSLASATETTGANGTTPTDAYTAGTTTGTCTVTATSATLGTSSTLVITTTTPADVVTITGAPTTPVPVSSGAFYLTATVKASGTAVSGDMVTFSASGAPAASCPAISSTPVTTNSSGQAQVAYAPTATPGFCTVTATEASTGGSGSVTIDQESSPTPTAVTVGIGTSPTILIAGGTTSSTVTITVTNGGIPIANDGVQVSTGTNGACGSLSSSTVTTNSSGVATDTYTAPATAGTPPTCLISATEASGATSSVAPATLTLATALVSGATVPSLSITSTPASTVSGGSVLDLVNGGNSQQFTVIPGGLSLTTSLVSGTSYSTLGIGGPTNLTLTTGSVITLTQGTSTQNFTVTANTALPGTVPISPATANASYTAGTAVVTATGGSYAVTTASTVYVTSTTANASYPTTSSLVLDGGPTIVQSSAAATLDTIVSTPTEAFLTANSGGSASFTVTVTNSSGAVSGDLVSATLSPPAGAGFPCGTIAPTTPTATNTAGQVGFTYSGTTGGASVGFCIIKFTEATTGASTNSYVDEQ